MVVGFPVTQHKLVIRVCILCVPVLSLNGRYMHSMYTECVMLISVIMLSSSTIVVSAVCACDTWCWSIAHVRSIPCRPVSITGLSVSKNWVLVLV